MNPKLLPSLCIVLAGCATSIPKGPDTVVLTGRVVDASVVGAVPKHSVNADHTMAMGGVVGMLFAGWMGRPRYTVYDVRDAQGQTHVARSTTEFAVGTCVDIVVPKAKLTQALWDIGEVGMEAGKDCR